MRAYDNSRREVLGTVTLELTIGPMIKKVEFQVLNIVSCFNMLLGRPWIHDTEVVSSFLYQKVRFPHEGAIVTIYGDTLTVPKPIFGINYENEPLTLDGFEIEKPSFGRREEEVERIPMDFAPYSNNNVVTMMRKMNYLPRMNLGKIVKEATAQVSIIPTAKPPFELGYKPTDDDLLEMEVRRMARAKAKAKGLSCPSEPLKPYTPTLNGKFVKIEDSQCYWGFLEPRYDPELKTMVPRFELFFDCDNKIPELKKEVASWVPTDWADYMDPDAMTTLLRDTIYNIEEEEYWEACQHALKSPYEARTDDEDEEEGEAPSDDDKDSDNKSDNSSDNSSSDNGDSGDNNSSDSDSDNSSGEDYDSQDSDNDRGEPPSDIKDEDVGSFYEDHYYYDGDIEDDVEIEDEDIENDVEAEGIDYNEYPYGRPLDWSCITDVSSRSGPRYDKHGREIPELGSFHNSELGSLTPYTEEEDDIHAGLAN